MGYVNVVSTRVARYSRRSVRTRRYPPQTLPQERRRLTSHADGSRPDHEKENRPFFGHVTFLKENGIHILETMNTGQLAKGGVREFLFVLGQARIRGAVQMIINPVAIY